MPAIIIIAREIFVSALREWMAEMNSRGLVAVSMLGKVKTTLQMIALVVLLANPVDLDSYWVLIGYVLLYVAAFMTLWSMVLYLIAAWPTLRAGFDTGRE
jgi:CDP-diacylglycerol--glycerol-3-phosphate 3-phosphatidyltransferase